MTLRRQFDLLPDRPGLSRRIRPAVGNDRGWLPVGAHPRFPDAARLQPCDRDRGHPDRDRLPEHRTQHGVFLSGACPRRTARPIGATEAQQQLDGKTYQRWSRHRTRAEPVEDRARSHRARHVILIEDWLDREFEKWPSRSLSRSQATSTNT